MRDSPGCGPALNDGVRCPRGRWASANCAVRIGGMVYAGVGSAWRPLILRCAGCGRVGTRARTAGLG